MYSTYYNTFKMMGNIHKLSVFTFLTTLAICSCNDQRSGKRSSNWVDSLFRSDTLHHLADSLVQGQCYLSLGGARQQDSSKVHLKIFGDKVTGTYNWIPLEKDSRRGVITGTKRGDTLDVVWKFFQEGKEDSLRTFFLLNKGKLRQRDFFYNEKTGKQNRAKGSNFNITYQHVNCGNAPI